MANDSQISGQSCGTVQEQIVRRSDLQRIHIVSAIAKTLAKYNDRDRNSIFSRVPARMQDLLVEIQRLELHRVFHPWLYAVLSCKLLVTPGLRARGGVDRPAAVQASCVLTCSPCPVSGLDSPGGGSSQSSSASSYSIPLPRHSACTPAPLASCTSTTNSASSCMNKPRPLAPCTVRNFSSASCSGVNAATDVSDGPDAGKIMGLG